MSSRNRNPRDQRQDHDQRDYDHRYDDDGQRFRDGNASLTEDCPSDNDSRYDVAENHEDTKPISDDKSECRQNVRSRSNVSDRNKIRRCDVDDKRVGEEGCRPRVQNIGSRSRGQHAPR